MEQHLVRNLLVKRHAFTLIEVIIVALIIGLLAAIAAPQWITARDNSRQKGCLDNLRQIDSAKETFAMQNNLPNGATVVAGDLCPLYIKGNFPSCPAGGVYTIQPIGTNPVCSYVSVQFPHVRP